MKRKTMACAIAAAAAAVSGFAVVSARADIKFNEVHYDASGTNSEQDFIELRSTTGGVESLDNLTLLMLEADSGAVGGSGVVDQILTFSGKSTGTGGLFLRHSITAPVMPAPPDPSTNSWVQVEGWTHENAAQTYILVADYTGGGIETDLDTDDDGVLDVTPWTSVHDAFGVLDGNVATDRVYGAALGGADFNNTVVGAAPVNNGAIRGVLRTADGAFHGARFTALNLNGKWTVNNGGTLANGFELSPGYDNLAANRPAQAWIGAAGGDWNVGTNWTTGLVPSAAGDVAILDGGGANTLSLTANATVATLSFNGGSHAIAAGGGTLTMDTVTGNPSVQVAYGNPSIAAPLALAKNTSFNVARGQVLTTADISGAGLLTKTNVGTLVLNGNNTYAGGTSLAGGTVVVSSDANLGDAAGPVTFSGGTLAVAGTAISNLDTRTVNWDTFTGGIHVEEAAHTFTASQPIVTTETGRLTKSGAGSVVVNSVTGNVLDVQAGTLNIVPNGGAGGMVVVKSLTVDPGATLHMNDNDLILDYTTDGITPSPEFAIRDLVKAVAEGGTSGIAFDPGNGNRVLAIAEGTESGLTDLNGVTFPDDTTVIGKHTYYGDANLDGQVTSDDYVAVDVGIGVGDSWVEGDFDFSGTVTSDDYVAIDVNLGEGSGNPLAFAELKAEMVALHTAMFGDSYVQRLAIAEAEGFAALVPEPGALSLVGIGAAGLLGRRRRKA